MKRFNLLLLALLTVLALASCGKDQEIVPIEGNVAPPDYTIPTITKESYVNRVYISLLGRKPNDLEFQNGLNQLDQDNMSLANREAFLDDVMDNYDYHYNLFDVGRVNYLNGADTTEMKDFIFVYNLLLQDPQYQPIWPIIQEEIDRMELVLEIPDDLASGAIALPEAHRRLVENNIYDEINMGTLNFVQSCFENFLFRYPTTSELDNGILMVDGFSATVFLQPGRNKDDFLTIFFSSTDYYEGQVRDVYQRFLFRDPDSVEMDELTQQYLSTGDYKALLKSVLSSDDYAGI